jgi:hypothetical protein
MRRSIKESMKSALPLWGQRLLEAAATGNNAAARDRKEAQVRGVESFAKARANVACDEPADKIRALLPIFLNTPVQDERELRDLVAFAIGLANEGGLSDETKSALADSQKLIEERHEV